ncbi:hypothetical protein LK09_15760 [Microbacterium mangrovi]|uniref:DUF2207 domain-containing protein n=1 Tax=Microbacterium mangrovi TaxID=1348253 RepID=A0A0B1ZYZ8_9MICO|nr:hypothetical protein LK09_15760 [Microbacterium mangrovi]
MVAVTVLTAVALIGGVLTGPSAPASAQVMTGVDDFSFQSMDADYTLGREPDGTSTLRVVETFVADFPTSDQNHGMRRAIPDTYQGQPLQPHLVSITDGAGNPRPASVDQQGGTFTMTSRSPDYLHGAQTFVFTYTLRHVTAHFADTGDDEFYWDVNGFDWPQQFGRVTATLHLTPELAKARTGEQACYVGAQGSTNRCTIDGTGQATKASAAPVAPHNTMTLAVGFTAGTFVSFDTSPLATPWGWAVFGSVLVGLVAVVLALRSRRRWLRDAPGRGIVIPEYTPPPGVDALEGALLLAKQPKAVPAEILEQAIGGSIRLVETGRSFTGKPKLSAQLVDASRADADGRMVLDAMFRRGPEFEFGTQNSAFASAVTKITGAITKELKARGYFAPVPAGARAWPILLAILAGLAGLGFLLAALAASADPGWLIFAMALFVPIIVVIAVLVGRRPLTAQGVAAKDHLAGLKMFIEWAEEDRIRMLQSPQGAERVRVDASDPRQMLKLYEALLPYAVVFGQEREWAKHLAVYTAAAGAAPVWYYGLNGGGFDADAFSAGIATLSAAATASSSTGGAGGGGFAGGGGGGGGGGGV